jgi:hypothetical protein
MKPCIVAAFAAFAVPAVLAGPVELSDEVNARLARAKVQQAGVADRAANVLAVNGVTALGGRGAAGAPAAGALGNGCNSASGNVFETPGRIGTSAKRETTVIVTGDVIQVGNNCR